MVAEKRSSSVHSKLTKAETLLVLALLTDLVIYPWLFSNASIPAAGKTLIKMALIVGLFGPVQDLLSRSIDRVLKTTRSMTESVFSLPRLAVHSFILGVLFMSYFWSMHHTLPWTGVAWTGPRAHVDTNR